MTVPRGVCPAAAVVLLVGCGGGGFSPTAGDCLRVGEADPQGGLTDLTIVGCDEPHELEVFHVFDLEEEEIAGEARTAAVAETCLGEPFTAYVGEAAEGSPLELLPLPPSSDEVAAGDREVVCAVRPPGGGTTTGSVRAGTPA